MRSALRRSYYPNVWGANPINPRYGVANVGDGMLLGCSCADFQDPAAAGARMQITCYIVALNALGGTPQTLNTTWEAPAEASLLRCPNVRILVQSIRWPQRRVLFARQMAGASTPLASSSVAADAAIYVIPSCGGEGSNPMACFDPGISTLSNCFPYCMALHLTSSVSGPASSSSLLFRGYTSWRDGVLIAARSPLLVFCCP